MKESVCYADGTTREVELDIESVTEATRAYQWMNRFLTPPYKMLNVGCGKGFVINHFREQGVEAYGIDIRNVFPKKKGYFILGDARTMPFPDETFDLVSEFLLFDYLINIMRDNPETQRSAYEILMEMHRVLKPGGYFYSEYGHISSSHLLSLGYRDLTHKNSPVCFTYQKPK